MERGQLGQQIYDRQSPRQARRGSKRRGEQAELSPATDFFNCFFKPPPLREERGQPVSTGPATSNPAPEPSAARVYIPQQPCLGRFEDMSCTQGDHKLIGNPLKDYTGFL